MYWHQRPFVTSSDADALLNSIRLRPAEARTGPLTLSEMQELLQLPQTIANIHVWLDTDSRLLGYAYLNPSNYLFFETIACSQRVELEGEMMQWGEMHLRQTNGAPHQSLVLASICVERNQNRMTTLEQYGFVLQLHNAVDMRRPLHLPLASVMLPTGFTIRPLIGEHEVVDLVALHYAAFQTQHLTVGDRLVMMRAPGYELNRDLVVVDANSKLVAYCTCWISREENEGQYERVGNTDPIAIHPDVQRQGIGRALLIACCHLLADHGADWACLSTSSQNGAMLGLAEAVGFSRVRKMLFFEKPVALR
jgi:mycothiol synthase